MLDHLVSAEMTLWERDEQRMLALRLPFVLLRSLVRAGKLSTIEGIALGEDLVSEFPASWRNDARASAKLDLSNLT